MTTLFSFRLKRNFSVFTVFFIIMVTFLSGCGTKAVTNTTSATVAPSASAVAAKPTASPAAEVKLMAVTQVSNWFAQPEHGGSYAALAKGYYKAAGLDMTITPGGPGISSAQIVASGKAQFGMGQADDILLAREKGIPLVAIMTTFQKNPQGIMVHKGQNIKSAVDLNGHKVFVGAGASYWEYLKKTYKLDKVQEQKYTGNLAGFVSDAGSGTQGYITSEPFTMKKQNVDVDFLLNADAGFNPYANLFFTTEAFLKDHPAEVKAFVEATQKGWLYYKDNYKEINNEIKLSSPDTPLENMEYSAVALQPLVFGGDAETNGMGYMSKERWDTLNKQMVESGVLKSSVDVTKVFTSQFFAKK
jgi:NitT/TauT family transport system substrate-binding protein